MHSFQERFVYSSLTKMASCQPRLGRKSYSVLLWFNFILGLNFVSLCSTQNKEKENLDQE